MLEVFEPGALNYFTFFRPILLTLPVSRNPILTHLPLSGFLDSMLCVLIAPTSGLAFSLLMSRTLGAVSSFSSDRAYPFFLRLIPTLIDYVGINIFLNNFSSLSFRNVYTPLFASLRRMAEPTPFLPPFFPSPEIFLFWETSIAITASGTQEVLPIPAGKK